MKCPSDKFVLVDGKPTRVHYDNINFVGISVDGMTRYYEFVSMIAHVGKVTIKRHQTLPVTNIHSGHYVCIKKKINKSGFSCYDDDKVTDMSEDAFIKMLSDVNIKKSLVAPSIMLYHQVDEVKSIDENIKESIDSELNQHDPNAIRNDELQHTAMDVENQSKI